eukprot:TRINITY_DN40146_c0_g1_i1.p2 TRINITY_DN40146_c0_g1~~TRINITY_DN40146_c0_g1_i1.p2  ORF type:complete len:122 (+),score=3.53 TRINITY_DN40146_c0_g1_i1:52-417(+)
MPGKRSEYPVLFVNVAYSFAPNAETRGAENRLRRAACRWLAVSRTEMSLFTSSCARCLLLAALSVVPFAIRKFPCAYLTTETAVGSLTKDTPKATRENNRRAVKKESHSSRAAIIGKLSGE